MTKIIEIEICLDCPHCIPGNSKKENAYCVKFASSIEEVFEIPDWCKLPDKP